MAQSSNIDSLNNSAKIASRAQNRSRLSTSSSFINMMKNGWTGQEKADKINNALKDCAKIHRANLSKQFLGKTLIIDAGDLKVRANDTDYKFRPNSAFSHLTGLGQDYDPDAKLVFYPTASNSHNCVLYIRQSYDLDSDKFYSNSHFGEFWIGARPKLKDFADALDIEVKELDNFVKDIKTDKTAQTKNILTLNSAQLLEATDELRLVKLPEEIEQMRQAITITKKGFDEVIKQLDKAKQFARGERWIEGIFHQWAILEGNQEGYETIAAAGEHATTLHWIRNTGKIADGQLLLLDAGCEVDTLYTADITRTLPISKKFSSAQKDIYNLVLKAADAAFAVAKPGVKFSEVHNAAMNIIAQGLIDLKILQSSKLSEVLETQIHRRWMCHGTSHHLGIDVHDCAHAKKEFYIDGILKEGMIFTIEPGLYFKSFDSLVPDIYKGIGIRIEDDILITKNGAENLSVDFPRDIKSVENWMSQLSA